MLSNKTISENQQIQEARLGARTQRRHALTPGAGALLAIFASHELMAAVTTTEIANPVAASRTNLPEQAAVRQIRGAYFQSQNKNEKNASRTENTPKIRAPKKIPNN